MPFPAAFTPSNINMLVLRYTTGTLLGRQNRQPDMQGSRHWWLQNQPLSTRNCSHQAIPVWSRWAILNIEALKVFTVTRGLQTHSAKHFLTSSTVWRYHKLPPAMRSAVLPLFLPLQAPPAQSRTVLMSATPSLEHFTFIRASLLL